MEKQGRLQQSRRQVKSELRANDCLHARTYPGTRSVIVELFVPASVTQTCAPTHLPDVDPLFAASACLLTPIKAGITDPSAPLQLSEENQVVTHPAIFITSIVATIANAACPVKLPKGDQTLAELTVLLAIVIAFIAKASAPMLWLAFKARLAHTASRVAQQTETVITHAVIVLYMFGGEPRPALCTRFPTFIIAPVTKTCTILHRAQRNVGFAGAACLLVIIPARIAEPCVPPHLFHFDLVFADFAHLLARIETFIAKP